VAFNDFKDNPFVQREDDAGVGRVLFWAQRCQGRYGGSGLFVGTPRMATAF